MNWYDLTYKYHEMTFAHDGNLASLSEEWQRELAAVWRLEADVNSGGYLQFIAAPETSGRQGLQSVCTP